MPILLAILGILGAAAVWYWRIKNASEMSADLLDAANNVRLAARRFNYKRRNKTHPADCVDDPRVAAAAIIVAVGGMETEFSAEHHAAAVVQCQSKFDCPEKDANDIMILGKWIAQQCNTKDEAVRRLSKRLFSLSGAEAGPDLVEMVNAIAKVDEKPGDSREADAMAQIKRTFFH